MPPVEIQIIVSGDSTQVDKFSNSLNKLAGSSGTAGSATEKAGKTFSGLDSIMGGSINAAGLLEGAFGTLGIAMSVKGVADLAIHGAEVQKTEGMYRNLAAQAGISGEQLLASFRRASNGTVSDSALMQTAINSMIGSVKMSGEQMTRLMEIAKSRGEVLGMSAADAYSYLGTAIEYQSTRMLRSLKLNIDATAANEKYAASHGLVAKEMTEAEQQAAMLDAILEATAGDMGNFAGTAGDAEEAVQRAKTELNNTTDALGKSLTPALIEATKAEKDFFKIMDQGVQSAQKIGDIITITNSLEFKLGTARQKYDELKKAREEWAKAAAVEKDMDDPGVKALYDRQVEYLDRMLDKQAGVVTEATAQYAAYINAGNEMKHEASGWAGQLAVLNLQTTGETRVTAELTDAFVREAAALKNDAENAKVADKAWSDFMAKRQQAVGTLLNSVKTMFTGMLDKAMQPTSVTAFDEQEAALGRYVDKWDEFARRADAIAKGTNPLQYGADWAKMFGSLGLSAEDAAKKFRDFSLFADPKNLELGLINFDAMSASVETQIDQMIGKFNFMQKATNEVWGKMSQGQRDALLKMGIANADDFTKKMFGIEPTKISIGKSDSFDAVLGSMRDAILTNIPPEMSTTVWVTYLTAPPPATPGSPGGAGANPAAAINPGIAPFAAGGAGFVTRSGLIWIDRGEQFWASGTHNQVPAPASNQTIVLKVDGKVFARAVASNALNN